MKNQNLTEFFDGKFKFQINQSLRHKGDSKESYSADMGLLVLERHIIESEDDDGNRLYERAYVCRTIQFSGSGQLMRFSEKELMTVEEHEIERENVKAQSQKMRNEVRQMQKEVYEAFGISEESVIYLNDSEGGRIRPLRILNVISINQLLLLRLSILWFLPTRKGRKGRIR